MNFLFYVVFTPIITTTMMRVMYMSENSMKINDAVARVHLILDIAPLAEPKEPQKPQGATVVLENVTYCYSEDAQSAVKNLTLSAEEGQIVALIGPSGGGKTTASRLAARFWDVDKGRVSVGGVDVKSVDPETLLSAFSIVFQDVTLFNSTVMENIRVGMCAAPLD